jgi:hypothetical protein
VGSRCSQCSFHSGTSARPLRPPPLPTTTPSPPSPPSPPTDPLRPHPPNTPPSPPPPLPLGTTPTRYNTHSDPNLQPGLIEWNIAPSLNNSKAGQVCTDKLCNITHTWTVDQHSSFKDGVCPGKMLWSYGHQVGGFAQCRSVGQVCLSVSSCQLIQLNLFTDCCFSLSTLTPLPRTQPLAHRRHQHHHVHQRQGTLHVEGAVRHRRESEVEREGSTPTVYDVWQHPPCIMYGTHWLRCVWNARAAVYDTHVLQCMMHTWLPQLIQFDGSRSMHFLTSIICSVQLAGFSRNNSHPRTLLETSLATS